MDYGYQPRHRRQLDGSPNEGVNCGVIATGIATDMATRGKLRPSPAQVRVRMRAPSGPTNTWDVERAIDSYDTKAELPDPYIRLRGRRETDGDADGQWSDVLDWLPDGKDPKRNGRSWVGGIDYGILRRLAPNKTGSESFDDWHGITLTAVRTKRRRRGGQVIEVQQVRVYDALDDKRYRGCPKGPVWIDGWKVRDSAFAYGRAVHGKAGRVAGVFVPPGEREAGPEPPPDPCEDVERELLEAYAAINEAIDDLADITATDPAVADAIADVLDELRDALPTGVTGAPDAVVSSGMTPDRIDRG